MRKLITTIALLALVDTSVAIAQRAGSSTNPDEQLLLADAPVGHRQPRADQAPSEVIRTIQSTERMRSSTA
jgi:hypothetical protein